MDFAKARFNMVEQQIRPWDVLDFDLLDALQDLPRELFVSEEQKAYAYSDTPLPLPNGGTMLEPKIVARLVQGLALQKTDSVLEIGTGSGYATALLAKLCGEVTTIDLDADQQVRAKMALTAIAQENVIFQTGDGLAAAVGGGSAPSLHCWTGMTSRRSQRRKGPVACFVPSSVICSSPAGSTTFIATVRFGCCGRGTFTIWVLQGSMRLTARLTCGKPIAVQISAATNQVSPTAISMRNGLSW